jgi:putative sterol carrier protein
MATLNKRFGSRRFEGSEIYQFCLTGEGGGDFYFRGVDGKGVITEGLADSPNLTVTMSAVDFTEMLSGTLSPTAAFMSGKLKVKGDMMLAMKLQGVLS